MNKTGLVCWEPNGEGAARIQQNRYYFNGLPGQSSVVAATSLPGKRGTGVSLAMPFDTRGRFSAVEISNTLDEEVEVNVITRLGSGALTSTLPEVIVMPAKSTRHLVLSQHLANNFGSVVIKSSKRNSIITSLFEYGLELDGRFQFIKITLHLKGLRTALKAHIITS